MKFLALAPEWVSKSFPIIRYVFMFLIAAAAITLIVATLMQETKEGG